MIFKLMHELILMNGVNPYVYPESITQASYEKAVAASKANYDRQVAQNEKDRPRMQADNANAAGMFSEALAWYQRQPQSESRDRCVSALEISIAYAIRTGGTAAAYVESQLGESITPSCLAVELQSRQ